MSRAAQPLRIGIDVGGTFTDFVLVDEVRRLIFTGKRLTTPDDPSRAIVEGLDRLLAEAGAEIGQARTIVHGTTLVANTVIERKGAKVGLVTTRGFRDSLELGKEMRYDLYDLFFEKPEPLVPRRRRVAAGERLDAEGNVLLPLNEAEMRDAAWTLRAEGAEAVAVCFMHAYRNPVHERRAREILAEELPGVPVTLSSDVAPEIREYERANTACANTYVQPLMDRYLAKLQSDLEARGLRGTLHVMLSGGGLASVRAARAQPVQMIESGPAAGAIAATFYSRLTGVPDLISFDMGGTTAKMCLVEGGAVEHAGTFEAARVRRFHKGSGLPLMVPVIDLIEIGAGGGSIAWVDGMGLAKVGSESAGAVPGPVCYRRGGMRPTVTDADLLLGYLSPEYFLGGEMRLELDAVRDALKTHFAEPMGMSVTDAAAGIHRIVNENMAAATRMYIAEKGRDPRRYALMAFGGAGPVHAYGVARLLKLRQVFAPLGAGVMSALGFLVAAPAIDLVRSYVARLDHLGWAQLGDLFAAMEGEARALLVEAGAAPEEIVITRTADMRYVGQGFEIPVPVPPGTPDAEMGPALHDSFLAAYQRLFERRIEEVPIEALTWRVHATAPQSEVALNFAGGGKTVRDPVKGTRQVHFPETGYIPCRVLDRYALRPGDAFRGPAVVEEREATVVVGPDASFRIDEHLNLIMDMDPPPAATAADDAGKG